MYSSNLYDYIVSDKNIFLAIYSVKTYIFNPELLDEKNRIILEGLQDIFDENYICDTIKIIRNRINEVLINHDEFFVSKVFFKPKKYEENRVVYRPLHVADVYEQIAMVALLNIFIYEIPEAKTGNKLMLSNYSRLIPSNFYGNRVSIEPEELFKCWSEQYKEYTHLANEYFKKYHSTKEYLYEVKLDLENFFPSVNPVIVYNYLIEKAPVTIEDMELYKTALIKLLVCKVDNLQTETEKREYYGKGNIPEENYTVGIPQGLPQSYFMGNICMIEISKVFNSVFKGKSLYYVDDSVIFTKEGGEEFLALLGKVNNGIKDCFSKYCEINCCDDYFGTYNSKLSQFIAEWKYSIRVHDTEGKSSCAEIACAKKGEINLKCLSREASKTSFDIFTSYSDEEDELINSKISMLLEAIEAEEKKISKRIEQCKTDQEKQSYKNYKEKLIRYKKFFKYRHLKIELRKAENTEEILKVFSQGKEIKEGESRYSILQNTNIDIEEFIELYKNDIWNVALVMLIRNEMEQSNRNIILNYVKNVERTIYGEGFKNTSYISKSFDYFLKNKGEFIWKNNKYYTLDRLSKEKMRPFLQKHSDAIKRILTDNRQLQSQDEILRLYGIVSDKFREVISVVDANSDEIKRMILNTVYSQLFNVSISDSFIITKQTKKPLYYGELKCLLYLRNKHFRFADFSKNKVDFQKPENWVKVDLSIMEVLESYKTFILKPELIDNLVTIHQYTCDVWKNGSKHLYFYTLHNQEHAIDLIKNIIKLTKAISFLQISYYDYYILFIACYLHDISMVKIPSDDMFLLDTEKADEIVCDFIERMSKDDVTNNPSDINLLKGIIVSFYRKVDEYFEEKVRGNHAKESAKEIRERVDLGFLERSLREVVAEVAEAHGSNVEDVYNVRSNAANKLISKKFDKILLRLADLLDMSEYRVSKPILNHNLENMSKESAFHWVSHLLTNSYEMKTHYEFANDVDERSSYLEPQAITEHLILEINVDISQMSGINNDRKCGTVSLDEMSLSNEGFELRCGKTCTCKSCNFLCKWFLKKNWYLVNELHGLRNYLNRVQDRFYNSDVTIRIKVRNKTALTEQQFEIIKNIIE